MTREQLEKLENTIREANLSPMQKMKCFTCGHCNVYRDEFRCYCKLHQRNILNGMEGAMESVCFQYMPLMED